MIRKGLILMVFACVTTIFTNAQGYKVGDEVETFTLKNIDDRMVSLDDYKDQKGVVVIFTCNHCPYSVAYEDRIISINKKFKSQGFPVVAINPNDAELYPSDSFEEMKVRAKEKGFIFPYLHDEKQQVFPVFGATKTPHVYLLQNVNGTFVVKYIGAIDNNTHDESQVTETYLSDAIEALLSGKSPNPDFTKAIGCSIKVKK